MAPLDPAKPRQHHYMFGHLAVPELLADQSAGLFAILLGPKGLDFLLTLWKRVGEVCARQNEPVISPDGLCIHACKVADCPTIIIQFPLPVGLTECYFSALVLLHSDAGAMGEESKPPTSYFTLERGEHAGEPRTVLCSWVGQGEARTHLNFGSGPEPTPQAFADFLQAHVLRQLERPE